MTLENRAAGTQATPDRPFGDGIRDLRRQTVDGLNGMPEWARAVRTYNASYVPNDRPISPRIVFASRLGVYSVDPSILRAGGKIDVRFDPFNQHRSASSRDRFVYTATSKVGSTLAAPDDSIEAEWPNDKTKGKLSNSDAALTAIHDGLLEIFDPERAEQEYQRIRGSHGLEKADR